MKVYIGCTVLPDGIRENWLTGTDGGSIVCSAPADSARAKEFLAKRSEQEITRLPADRLLAPAFVDIHCHAGDGIFSYEDPKFVMDFHRKHGTGSMLHTLYRDIGHEGMLCGIEKIKTLMQTDRGVLGVHLEGPYLNPAYGCKVNGKGDTPEPEKVRELLNTGVIRMWTYAPEVEGTDAFCREIVSHGVVGAIGHSAASLADVQRAAKDGATVVTHLFDATGMTDGPITYRGTKNLTFDEACMLEDGFFYEIINDRVGIHVRHEMIRLLVKTVGKEKVVAITDCFGGEQESGGDVNIQGGEISGSRMTMLDAARNFLAMGYSLSDVFGFVAKNPAKAIHAEALVGSIEEGKQDKLLCVSPDLSTVEWA